MSSILESSVEAPAQESPYLFGAEEFRRMIDLDLFPDESRVFLWDGRIYEKMAKKHPHSLCWTRLNAALMPILPPGWSLWAECSLSIGPDKVPLPDLLILRGTPGDFEDRRPEAGDVGLLVEVADSSLKIDTGAKLAAYARAGVATYWVINLRDNVIHVHADPVPSEGRYASAATVSRDGSIPFALDGKFVAMIAASDLLPAR